ncbi:MAG: ATP-binding protein [Syntrophobacteraceae bacterium]
MDRDAFKAPRQGLLNRYEKLYSMLLDAIPSSVLLINRDMRIISANRNFLEKSKRSKSNTIGHPLDVVFPATILERMDIVRRIGQVFRENRPTRGERMTYRAPALPMRVYYYIILPFTWEGVVESAMLLMEDVTEQIRLSEDVRRLERHLASVVECANDLIISTDTNGRVLTWNRAAETISGYGFEETKGKPFVDYCTADRHEDVRRVLAEMHTQQNSVMVEWDITTKDGNFIPVYWVLSPLREGLSQSVGLVMVGRDLTERRKLEMQLLQSQKLAALGVMAGGIAHEIRNPLAICSSGAQFLMEEDVDAAFRKECGRKIHAGIQRASIIIENLLRFAHPSAKTDVTLVNLCSLLEETLTLVASQAKIQKIEVVCSFSKETVMITGVESLLQQVFINLFLNALNSMPDGGCLNISVNTTGNEALVRITDTGSGINRADIDKIFDPFYTTSPVGKGTGLGLSICYSIVKHHFGSIEVDSSEGKGSTFTVKLPAL